MLKALSLVFRRRTPSRFRLMALASVMCLLYFTLMTWGMTSLAWSGILPQIFKNDIRRIVKHRMFILFVFINAVGNCILCIVTNTSVKKFLKNVHIKCMTDKSESCKYCKCFIPPRSHHCPLCETCILKRDHHCFFLTVCIGYHNQKYFIMFCFYMLLGTFYGMFLIVKYLKDFYNVVFYGPQTFIYLFFTTFLKILEVRDIDNLYIYLIFMMFGCLSAGLMASALWFWQVMLTFSGQSTFESSKGIMDYSSSRYKNFKEVFGTYWLLTLLLPLPLPQCSDGFDFSKISINK